MFYSTKLITLFHQHLPHFSRISVCNASWVEKKMFFFFIFWSFLFAPTTFVHTNEFYGNFIILRRCMIASIRLYLCVRLMLFSSKTLVKLSALLLWDRIYKLSKVIKTKSIEFAKNKQNWQRIEKQMGRIKCDDKYSVIFPRHCS